MHTYIDKESEREMQKKYVSGNCNNNSIKIIHRFSYFYASSLCFSALFLYFIKTFMIFGVQLLLLKFIAYVCVLILVCIWYCGVCYQEHYYFVVKKEFIEEILFLLILLLLLFLLSFIIYSLTKQKFIFRRIEGI